MTLLCDAPDTGAGVALGLSDYLDCQARALGENGFQAIAGGPLGMSLLTGLLTIFIGLIGYRMILGETPGIRHGVNWMVRVGFVLALVTSWPAFQTLIYRVVVDGPVELAGIMIPASGVPADDLDARVQQAYDTIRLGSAYQLTEAQPQAQPGASPAADPNAPAAPPQGPTVLPTPYGFQPPMPQTASLLVVSTSGFTGAFRIAVGFLLAVGPLAIMALLFDATLGIFAGWIRALTGMAFAALAAVVVTAIGLMVVETQLAHLQAMRFGGLMQSMDPQGLTTIVVVLALVTLVTSLAAMRMTAAFTLLRPATAWFPGGNEAPAMVSQPAISALRSAQQLAELQAAHTLAQTRVAGVAEALASTVRREQAILVGASAGTASRGAAGGESPTSPAYYNVGLGTIGRRSVGRRTRSAARRDKSGS